MPQRGRCLALLVLWVLAAVWMPGAGTLVAHATVGVALQTSTYLYDYQVRHENDGDNAFEPGSPGGGSYASVAASQGAIATGSSGDLTARDAGSVSELSSYDDNARLRPPTLGSDGQNGTVSRSNGTLLSSETAGAATNTAGRISGSLWSATKARTAPQNALRHFSDHGADFPHLNNASEYVAEAQQFLRTPSSGTLTITRTNGDVVRYDPSRNIFGVMDSAGAPKTYFKPDPAQHGYASNMDYFNAQNW